jgi:hypothetical protein
MTRETIQPRYNDIRFLSAALKVLHCAIQETL